MKTFIITLMLAIILMLSCNQEPSKVSSNNYKNKPDNTGVLSGPTQKYYKAQIPMIAHCEAPKRDCFPETVVTAPRKKIEDDILSYDIINNIVYQYFDEANIENYEILFPGFVGPALSDLRDNVTTLRRIQTTDSSVNYYIIFVNDTNSSPDYSEYY